MSGFITLHRVHSTVELLQDPKAWTLLSLIAIRARWSGDTISIHGLLPGQAFIGDCKSCGLSPKEYITAKKRLEKWGLVSFKGTNKGTIATLLNRDVYDIYGKNRDEPKGSQTASKGISGVKPATTNENGTQNRKLKPKDVGERGNDSPRIEINDYGDILNPNNPPIAVACAVTGDDFHSKGAGFFYKAHQEVGDKLFRGTVAQLWGEMKSDEINSPGAMLTFKFKNLMTGVAK